MELLIMQFHPASCHERCCTLLETMQILKNLHTHW
jgi:hypothetical protein